ncbi:MAG: hypothetical protein HRU19_19380 [Pseudobacteriovorax sp.]|nr:hypothetical protein [Pseudobacteriovorax sp.]
MSKIINSIIVIGSLLGSSSFLGAQETLQEVNREFSRINQQMSRLDSVEVEFAKFKIVRDRFNGEKGDTALVNDWYIKAASWLGAWSYTIEALKEDSSISLKNIDVQEKVRAEIRSQMGAALALEKRAKTIIDRLRSNLTKVRGVERFRPGYITGYESQIEDFGSNTKNLQSQIQISLRDFSLESSDQLFSMVGYLDELITLKLKNLAIEFPELEQVLADTKAKITLSRMVYSKLDDLNKDIEKSIADITRQRSVFKAHDQFKSTIERFGDLIIEVDGMEGVPNEFLAEAKGFINDEMIRNNEELDALLSVQGIRSRFITMYDRLVRTYAPACAADSPNRQKLDCPLLKSISGFSRTNLESMEVDTLKVLEEKLALVFKGPIQ